MGATGYGSGVWGVPDGSVVPYTLGVAG